MCQIASKWLTFVTVRAQTDTHTQRDHEPVPCYAIRVCQNKEVTLSVPPLILAGPVPPRRSETEWDYVDLGEALL